MKTQKNIGLYFGSFNPIHVAHVAIVEYLITNEHPNLNQIWVIPSPQNPLKESSELWDFEKRIELVKEAFKDQKNILVSDIESTFSQPSYTINTIEYLVEKNPICAFYLIMGSDNIVSFDKWKDWKKILQMVKLLVVKRPGSDNGLMEKIDFLTSESKISDQILVLENAPFMDVSATDIRSKLKSHQKVDHLIPLQINKKLEDEGEQ